MVFNDALYNPEILLAEADSILRDMPPISTLQIPNDETLAWLGRANALIEAWDPSKSSQVVAAMLPLDQAINRRLFGGSLRIATLIRQARSDLILRLAGPISNVYVEGMVFDYFDQIVRILEQATKDVLFVDPYMNADFIRRFMPPIESGVRIRLLTSDNNKQLTQLMPAAELFSDQHQQMIEVQTDSGLHDRYLFVDETACYQSGGSFKDGAKKAAATITQITDAFSAIYGVYSEKWLSAKKP